MGTTISAGRSNRDHVVARDYQRIRWLTVKLYTAKIGCYSYQAATPSVLPSVICTVLIRGGIIVPLSRAHD